MSDVNTHIKIDTKNLAKLSYLDLTEGEHNMYQKDIKNILNFIEIIQNVSIDEKDMQDIGFAPIQTLRDDISDDLSYEDTIEKGKKLINAAAESKDNAVLVKKVIS